MKSKTRKILLLIVILCAAGFLCFGLARGEGSVVLSRAVSICLECIGLGK